jgi:hypothetical protein
MSVGAPIREMRAVEAIGSAFRLMKCGADEPRRCCESV